MAKRNAQIRLSGRFPVGTTVELREVSAGALPGGPPAGAVVTRAKTNRDSITVFEDGVIEGKRYQASAEVDGVLRAVTVTGKVPADDKLRQERPDVHEAGVLTDPHGEDDHAALDDARREKLGEGAEEAGALIAPGNMPRQDEATDVLQRSNTPVGEAVPKDEDEVVPYPSQEQDEFSDGSVVQRSDTPLGMATPIPDVPRSQQEATERGIWQASDTPLGEAAPLRDGGPVVDRLAQDHPAERAGASRVDPAPGPGGEPDGGDPEAVTEPGAPITRSEDLPADKPWTHYDDMTADELKEQIGRKRSTEQLEGVVAYEGQNRNRSTVIAAAQDRLDKLNRDA